MQLKNSIYYLDNISVLDICNEFGTPVYVYSTKKMLEKYQEMSNAFQGMKYKIKYACKALTNTNILKLFQKAGAGLDVVSLEELKLGLSAGFSPSEILFTPNCVSFKEISEAAEMGVMVNIDNISILEQFGHFYGNTIPVCIRINPHILAGGSLHISTGHIDSKFGISIHQIKHVLRIVKGCQMNINGLHMHTGSDILESDVFIQGAELLFETAKDFPDLKFIDLGSGFKVSYKPNDITTDIEDFGKKLTTRWKEFCKSYNREIEIWVEPGKFLVSEAGYFLVKVNVVKQTTSTLFAGVNSGFNHLIRPMFYNAEHKIVNISNPNGTNRIYTVVGYICETDTFGWDRKLNEVRESDILAIYNAGAYGFTMSSNYNSRPRPAEVLIHNGKTHLIRRAESIDDIRRNEVEVDL